MKRNQILIFYKKVALMICFAYCGVFITDFCLTMAPDEDAMKRVHDKLGLPFDSITKVSMAGPELLFSHCMQKYTKK